MKLLTSLRVRCTSYAQPTCGCRFEGNSELEDEEENVCEKDVDGYDVDDNNNNDDDDPTIDFVRETVVEKKKGKKNLKEKEKKKTKRDKKAAKFAK